MSPVIATTSYKIVPLSLGRLEMSGAVLLRLRHFEVSVFPCIGYLILGGAKTVLVDSGAPEPDAGAKTPRKVLREETEYLLPQLARFGLGPDDIDIIINTHLHWDHVYGNNKLPKAEIIVQQAELDYYADPLPCDCNSYEKNAEVPFVGTFLDRVRPVRGDVEIMPGIRCLFTPGHTPGCQSVVVDTAHGPVVLPGDNITLYDGMLSNPPWLPGIVVDARDFYQSWKKIEQLGKTTILPAHDMKTLEYKG